MQIKEYEAYTLKECLQQVRDDLGPEAVILETRKIRKGGVLGMGSRDAVCIVAAIGISVKEDLASRRSAAPAAATRGQASAPTRAAKAENDMVARAKSVIAADRSSGSARQEPDVEPRGSRPAPRNTSPALNSPDFPATEVPARTAPTTGQNSAVAAARNAYARSNGGSAAKNVPASNAPTSRAAASQPVSQTAQERRPAPAYELRMDEVEEEEEKETQSSIGNRQSTIVNRQSSIANLAEEARFAILEQAMREIREGLSALQREQKTSHERTVSAVVSAVTPAINAATHTAQLTSLADANTPRFPEIHARLVETGVSSALAHELLDELPDFSAWSEEAQEPLAISGLRDLIARRVCSAGPIDLTPGQLKAVALIGPTGVGKTTTIAKLAAHFALVEKKKVALLTMDTYRIAAVEQLKIYSQILDIPVGVAYSQAELAPVIAQFVDFDLLLIDTAGRSQKNIMQVGELKSLLEAVGCETHLVLSSQTKEQDMLESIQRFAAARVDRLIFSKLDETDSYGTLLNVAYRTGLPLSYLTTGQKVPEDLELADGGKLAGLLLA